MFSPSIPKVSWSHRYIPRLGVTKPTLISFPVHPIYTVPMTASSESLLEGLGRPEEAARELRATGTGRLGWKPDIGTDAPIRMLVEMTNPFTGTDDGLRASEVTITGAAVKPLEMSGGEELEVSEGGSSVSASID